MPSFGAFVQHVTKILKYDAKPPHYQSRDSNVSVSSRSRHHTSRLHRTSKFKLITNKKPSCR